MKAPDARTLAIAAMGMLAALPALGDQASPAPPSMGALPALIMWAICASQRKNPIGGWLLYFYIQMYLAIVGLLISDALTYQKLLPSNWSYAPRLYWAYLFITLPSQLLIIAQLAAAETLRLTRDARYLRLLRHLLWADLVVSISNILVSHHYFRPNYLLDAIQFIWPLVLLPYLYLSKRVQMVFVTKTWEVPQPDQPKAAPPTELGPETGDKT